VGDHPDAPLGRGLEPPAAATAPAPPLPPAARLRAGVRKPQNWLQLAKFCAVGGSGYAVNIAVFALAVEVGDLHHLAAATAAFLVAVTNNFWWNRHWTFAARDGHAGFQAARFLAVSVVAFVFAATVLELLVSVGGLPEIPAQAISIVVATPLSFLGNKIWSFGSGDWRA
jgi:putative flippase GtrA